MIIVVGLSARLAIASRSLTTKSTRITKLRRGNKTGQNRGAALVGVSVHQHCLEAYRAGRDAVIRGVHFAQRVYVSVMTFTLPCAT